MKINVTEYLDETVERCGSKIAIEDAKGKISFEQLKEMSQKIAISIMNQGLKTNVPIGVLLPKSKESITAFIGCLYSGNFYAPLDVKSPNDRIEKIIDKLNPLAVITDAANKEILIKCKYKGKIIVLEEVENYRLSIEDSTRLKAVIESKIDLDPVYSIFTSGSTGSPKGVLISHRGVIDYIEWARSVYEVTESEVIGSQAPFYFDNSTLDIYLMLATGATLIIVPEDRYMFPIKLLEYLEEKNINFVFWVPSVLVNVANFDALDTVVPKTLKKVLFAGEAMPNKHLNYWRSKMPNILYSNLYGPTEITVDCTYYIVDRKFNDDEPLPIGKACKNSGILILNEENQEAATKEIGELCVRGSSLAFGYYNDPSKTKEAFVQNPLNSSYPEKIYRTGDLVYYNEESEIIFVGRKDSQIKHMGYRIELGEIENVILGLNEVDNVCVIYNTDKKQIVSVYLGKGTVVDIRKKLMNSLPKYMIPTKWYKVESFPLNNNGKIDRKQLKAEFFK